MQNDRSEDTLITADFTSGCSNGYLLYSSTNGGYATGTNGYGHLAKGQFYALNGSASVVGLYVWYGAKKLVDGSSTFVASINDTNQTVLGTSNTKTLADIDTNMTIGGAQGCTEYTFSTPVSVTSDFYAFVTVGGADTVGIVSTQSPCGTGAYQVENTGTVSAFSDTWGIDIDLGILPLVNNLGYTGLFDSEASDFGVYTNQNTLFVNAINSDVIINAITIYDMSGRLVKLIPVKDQFQSYSFDISELIAGNYIISLNTNRGTIGQKINIK